MSKANLRPVDVPANLVSSLEKAISRDFPDRGTTSDSNGYDESDHLPDRYAPPDVRRVTERLINRDHLAMDAEAARMRELAEEIRTSPLDMVKRKLLALVYGDMIELCESIMKEAGDKPVNNADELAKLVHRSASSLK
jgi:hypothetical protein